MIVCSCNVLSADAVRACAAGKGGLLCSLAAVYRELGCRTRCGRCARAIRSVLSEAGCSRCLSPTCGAGAASAANWMTLGTLARISVKPFVDFDQGAPSTGA